MKVLVVQIKLFPFQKWEGEEKPTYCLFVHNGTIFLKGLVSESVMG